MELSEYCRPQLQPRPVLSTGSFVTILQQCCENTLQRRIGESPAAIQG
jgi:hypothetical protein